LKAVEAKLEGVFFWNRYHNRRDPPEENIFFPKIEVPWVVQTCFLPPAPIAEVVYQLHDFYRFVFAQKVQSEVGTKTP
jgi:hypothetical protein